MVELYYSNFEGISVPLSKIDYLRWKAEFRRSYKISYNVVANASPEFSLTSLDEVVFQQYLFSSVAETPIVVDQMSCYTSEPTQTSLLQSELFLSLSKKMMRKLQSILELVVTHSMKISSIKEEIEKYGAHFNKDEMVNNTAWQNAQERLQNRESRLVTAEIKLHNFFQRRGKVLHEEATIRQAREWPEWNSDVERFFRGLQPDSNADDSEDFNFPSDDTMLEGMMSDREINSSGLGDTMQEDFDKADAAEAA